ncbi:predicted protein [Nematostella vectensis]|uniref:Uncharacterized protein n=1 Tax=Nematostella vectensis TaxID=45351 RepID=A7RLU2_NEMVE|nr:predicted protein [Nematostella vectensis]|eukprot:XP_001639546.1 predicted protein [Nematostella vectensis]
MPCLCKKKASDDAYELEPAIPHASESEEQHNLENLDRAEKRPHNDFNLYLTMGQAGSSASQFDERVLFTLEGHKKAILNVEVGPDGKTLATCSADCTVGLWNITTGELLRTLVGHEKPVTNCAFMWGPSLKTPILATASEDGDVILWHYDSGKRAARLAVHCKAVTDCVFAKDGRALATSSLDGTICHYRIKPGAGEFVPGQETRTLRGHQGAVNVVAFSLDNRYIFSGSDDKSIRIWSRESSKCENTLTDSLGGEVRCLRFAPHGESLVVLAGDALSVWEMEGVNTTQWRIKNVLDTQQVKRLKMVCFIPDGMYFVGCSSDNSVTVWDSSGYNKRAKTSQTPHQEGILSCCFDPYGKHFITGDGTGITRIWV